MASDDPRRPDEGSPPSDESAPAPGTSGFATARTAAPRSAEFGRVSRSRLATGTEIGGDFVIERPLAEGGMGAVYVVLQRSTGVRRALKVMHETLIEDESLAKRFRREAELAATVESDHVVKVLTAGHDPTLDVAYLVMELLAGASLAHTLDRLAPLSPELTAAILLQIAHGLGAAGDLGIVHRDVKPENIFLCRASNATAPFFVKLLDFGVAKDVNHASRVGTQAVGTPFWLAPEQTESDPRLSPATDVWPVGLVAYACLVGRPFWRSAGNAAHTTPASFLRELLLEPIPLASVRAAEHGVTLPAGFDAWFATCIDRDPQKRFPEARVAARAFAATIAEPQPLAGELERLVSFLREEAAQTSATYIGFEPTVATPSPQDRPSRPQNRSNLGAAPKTQTTPNSREPAQRPELEPSEPAAPRGDRENAASSRGDRENAASSRVDRENAASSRVDTAGGVPMNEGLPRALYVAIAVAVVAVVAVVLWPRTPKPHGTTPIAETHGIRAGNYLCRLAPADDFSVPCILSAKGEGKLEMTVRGTGATCYVSVQRGDGVNPPMASGFCNRERGLGPPTSEVRGAVRTTEAETYEIAADGAEGAYLSFRGPIAK